jgi:hypothetical protein
LEIKVIKGCEGAEVRKESVIHWFIGTEKRGDYSFLKYRIMPAIIAAPARMPSKPGVCV